MDGTSIAKNSNAAQFSVLTNFLSGNSLLSTLFVFVSLLGILFWIYILACYCLQCTEIGHCWTNELQPQTQSDTATSCDGQQKQNNRNRNRNDKLHNPDYCRCGDTTASTYNMKKDWREQLDRKNSRRYVGGYDQFFTDNVPPPKPHVIDIEGQTPHSMRTDGTTSFDTTSPMLYVFSRRQQAKNDVEGLTENVAACASNKPESLHSQSQTAYNLEYMQEKDAAEKTKQNSEHTTTMCKLQTATQIAEKVSNPNELEQNEQDDQDEQEEAAADVSEHSKSSNKSIYRVKRRTYYRPKYMLSSPDTSWMTIYSSTTS